MYERRCYFVRWPTNEFGANVKVNNADGRNIRIMSTTQFSRRVSDFKARFSKLFGARAQGYEDLSTLERPLVAVEEDEEYEQQHGVARPGYATGYQAPSTGGAGAAAIPGERVSTGGLTLPSQAEEMQEISFLARDASEILWEMVAMGEKGAGVADMTTRAEQLQAQLRGLINDYSGGDEKLLAGALEAYDMLQRSLDNQKAPAAVAVEEQPKTDQAPDQEKASTGAEEQREQDQGPGMPASTSAPAATTPAEAPLISFD